MAGTIHIQPSAVQHTASQIQELVQIYLKEAQTLSSIMEGLSPQYQSSACKAAQANAVNALQVIREQCSVISRQAAYAQRYAQQAQAADAQAAAAIRRI